MLRWPLYAGVMLCLGGCAGLAPDTGRPQEKRDGVNVGEASVFRNVVSAEQIEKQAAQQYAQTMRQAASQQHLAPADHPDVVRLRAIAQRITPFAGRFNDRAKEWRWEVNLIGSPQINAFCMPGGKIAFYSALLTQLKLTDDEVAIVMGHEVAHALREHARERVGKTAATGLLVSALGVFVGGGQYASLFDAGGSLLNNKFSRDDETEADVVGLDLAARAGFDPRAGVTLWEKMAASSKGAPPVWLSTHPAGEDRIDEIQRHLPEVMPLYERTLKLNVPAESVVQKPEAASPTKPSKTTKRR